jgi:hypothetical protein
MPDDPVNTNPYAPGRTDVDVFGKPTDPGGKSKQDPSKTPKFDPTKKYAPTGPKKWDPAAPIPSPSPKAAIQQKAFEGGPTTPPSPSSQ